MIALVVDGLSKSSALQLLLELLVPLVFCTILAAPATEEPVAETEAPAEESAEEERKAE